MKDLLIKLNACQEAKDWVGNKTWEEAYETCPRGDWMLWLFSKTNPKDLQRLTLAKGHCANTVRHLMKDERSINAVDAAISYGEGKSTIEVLNAAWAAAWRADAADSWAASASARAAGAASAASWAAAYASSAAADAAAWDSSAAADAAAWDSAWAWASYAYAKKLSQLQTADICRKYLPIEIWNVK